MNGLATRRLKKMKDLKIKVHELKDLLADESQQRETLEQMSVLRLKIKKERAVGCPGKSRAGKWPVKIVLLICEMLVNGSSPQSIPKNIWSMTETITGEKLSGEMFVSFVKECRVVVQNLNEMLAADRLGICEKWKQVFTNGTT